MPVARVPEPGGHSRQTDEQTLHSLPPKFLVPSGQYFSVKRYYFKPNKISRTNNVRIKFVYKSTKKLSQLSH